jgi:hypothetical protein
VLAAAFQLDVLVGAVRNSLVDSLDFGLQHFPKLLQSLFDRLDQEGRSNLAQHRTFVLPECVADQIILKGSELGAAALVHRVGVLRPGRESRTAEGRGFLAGSVAPRQVTAPS